MHKIEALRHEINAVEDSLLGVSNVIDEVNLTHPLSDDQSHLPQELLITRAYTWDA